VKTYEGKREIDGLVVTVDGHPLSEHYEVTQFTTWGFEWSYEGASPQQLALANLDNDWTLTSEEIDRAVGAIA
jgi:hypothetical protein